MAKQKGYQVQAVLQLVVCIDVAADNLEQALDKSNKLGETDFIDSRGELLDSKFRISGVYESAPL